MDPQERTWFIVLLVSLFILVVGIIVLVVVTTRGGSGRRVRATAVTPDDWISNGQVLYDGDVSGFDLVVSATAAADSVRVEWRTFSPNNCAVQEGLVAGAGRRRLLRFTSRIINIGNADAVLGDPASNPNFHFSACHGHYHLDDFIQYDLLNEAGTETVAQGRKQAYCLRDNQRIYSNINNVNTRTSARYDCGDQGISVGWSDDYTWDLDGQWIDITELTTPGTYILRQTVNPTGILSGELDTSNNVAESMPPRKRKRKAEVESMSPKRSKVAEPNPFPRVGRDIWLRVFEFAAEPTCMAAGSRVCRAWSQLWQSNRVWWIMYRDMWISRLKLGDTCRRECCDDDPALPVVVDSDPVFTLHSVHSVMGDPSKMPLSVRQEIQAMALDWHWLEYIERHWTSQFNDVGLWKRQFMAANYLCNRWATMLLWYDETDGKAFCPSYGWDTFRTRGDCRNLVDQEMAHKWAEYCFNGGDPEQEAKMTMEWQTRLLAGHTFCLHWTDMPHDVRSIADVQRHHELQRDNKRFPQHKSALCRGTARMVWIDNSLCLLKQGIAISLQRYGMRMTLGFLRTSLDMACEVTACLARKDFPKPREFPHVVDHSRMICPCAYTEANDCTHTDVADIAGGAWNQGQHQMNHRQWYTWKRCGAELYAEHLHMHTCVAVGYKCGECPGKRFEVACQTWLGPAHALTPRILHRTCGHQTQSDRYLCDTCSRKWRESVEHPLCVDCKHLNTSL